MVDNIAYAKRITQSENPLYNYTDVDTWVKDIVNTIYNDAGYTMDKHQQDVLYSALNYRMTNAYDKDYIGLLFNKYNGIYEVLFTNGERWFIQLSSEPSHVLMRTTGRSGYSCEHMDNDAWLGPFHDIALMNPTAYLLTEDGKFMGRLNVRWALTNDNKPVIGVDPNVYPMHQDYKPRPDDLFKEALYYILKEDMQYDKAITPYLYKGHSDTTSRYPDVALPYTGYDSQMFKLNSRDNIYNYSSLWDGF